jgi:hypothetical protein
MNENEMEYATTSSFWHHGTAQQNPTPKPPAGYGWELATTCATTGPNLIFWTWERKIVHAQNVGTPK